MKKEVRSNKQQSKATQHTQGSHIHAHCFALRNCCLYDLACFFLPSSSLINLYAHLYTCNTCSLTCISTHAQGQAHIIQEAAEELGDRNPPLFDALGEGVDVKDLEASVQTTAGAGTGAKHTVGGKVCIVCAVLLCFVVCLTLLASFFLPSHLSLKQCQQSYTSTLCLSHPRQLIFDCLGCAVLLCLVVCLTLLASSFLLISH